MALSGKVGASASGLKINACTLSLNFETFFNISSAEKLSDTSQPVNIVKAPKLAPPAIKRRRDRSGIVFTASRTSNCLSTPGIRSERMRPMMCPPRSLSRSSRLFMFEHDLFRKTGSHFSGSCSASDNHGAQAFGYQHRQGDMNHQEGDDRRHATEVD